MKLICLVLAAGLSAGTMAAATRPHYGGTLRIETRATLSSFEPTANANADRQRLRDFILTAVCNRLTKLDAVGEPQPSLAASWRSERDGRSWYFVLRNDVRLQNGSALMPQMVVGSLSAANPGWQLRAGQRELLIQSDTPLPHLLYELAEPRNSIFVTGDRGQWIGSGTFQIAAFQEGQRLELQAFDEAWEGRPFLDRVTIEMGKPLADQLADFQLGKADVVELDPSQPRVQGTAKVSSSQPIDLFAIVFTANHPISTDIKVRECITRAIDRNSIYSVLLRRQGSPDSALIPEWISGYAHLFNSPQDLAAAKQLRADISMLAQLSMAYDGSDDLAKLIAERVAVNAREAGISIVTRPETPAFRGFNADLQLVRLRIESPETATALANVSELLNVASAQRAHSARTPDELYAIESELLKNFSIIPIAVIPEAFGIGQTVHDWTTADWGEVNFGNVWMEAPK